MGVFLCLFSAAAFGCMAIFGKLAYDDGVGVLTLLLVRFALAGLVLAALAAIRSRSAPLLPAEPRVRRRLVGTALALGAVGYATQAGLFFAALERVEASLLSLVLYTYPAFVTVAAIALGRERATPRRLAALFAASAGIALVLVGAGLGGATPDALGVAMGLGAAVTYTTYILVSDAVVGEMSPIVLSALVAAGASATFAVVGGAAGTLRFDFAPQGWLWLVLLSLVCTVAAVLAFFAGLARVGPSTASILSTFEPVMTVLLAFLAFSERLSAVQLVGGALVLSAVVILQGRWTRRGWAGSPRGVRGDPAQLGSERA
jgi:drug/metabolite transporter (DMT)-like permease